MKIILNFFTVNFAKKTKTEMVPLNCGICAFATEVELCFYCLSIACVNVYYFVGRFLIKHVVQMKLITWIKCSSCICHQTQAQYTTEYKRKGIVFDLCCIDLFFFLV